MRCVRCQSENMPGRERCFKCGSILEPTAVADIHPPRMPAWKGPFREIARLVRGSRGASEKPRTPRARQVLSRAANDALLGVVLSVVPGLAHALNRRFKEIRLHVLVWAILLSLGVFLYGSPYGFVCVGLAIGLHVWIALKFGLLQEIGDLGTRIGAIFVVTMGLSALYWAVPRVVFWGYAAGYTALTIPDMNVKAGDYLLIRRIGDVHPIPRGTLVLFRPSGYNNGLAPGVRTVGQIIGLPGETVSLSNEVFRIGGQTLDPERFPVPAWLRRRSAGVSVPKDSYFVSSAYTIGGHGGVLTDEIIRNTCIISSEEIRGRAFMRWWPLARRGFLE